QARRARRRVGDSLERPRGGPMSDTVSAAKSARESLARALAAIQSDPTVPPQLSAIAEPVSQAMGALFQIERSGGAAAAGSAPTALEAVRRALALLQQQPPNHPAVRLALESVAGSLGLIHRIAAPAPPAPAVAPAAQAPRPQQVYPQAQPAPAHPAPMQSPQAYAATYVAPTQAAYQPTVQAYQPPPAAA